jgi:hypothetical protein
MPWPILFVDKKFWVNTELTKLENYVFFVISGSDWQSAVAFPSDNEMFLELFLCWVRLKWQFRRRSKFVETQLVGRGHEKRDARLVDGRDSNVGSLGRFALESR